MVTQLHFGCAGNCFAFLNRRHARVSVLPPLQVQNEGKACSIKEGILDTIQEEEIQLAFASDFLFEKREATTLSTEATLTGLEKENTFFNVETTQSVYQDSLCESAQVLRSSKEVEQQALLEMEEAEEFMRQRKVEEDANNAGSKEEIEPKDSGWNDEALELFNHEQEVGEMAAKAAALRPRRFGRTGEATAEECPRLRQADCVRQLAPMNKFYSQYWSNINQASAESEALRRASLPKEETETTAPCELTSEVVIGDSSIQPHESPKDVVHVLQVLPGKAGQAYGEASANLPDSLKPPASKCTANRKGGWSRPKGTSVVLEETQVVPGGGDGRGVVCAWPWSLCCISEQQEDWL